MRFILVEVTRNAIKFKDFRRPGSRLQFLFKSLGELTVDRAFVSP